MSRLTSAQRQRQSAAATFGLLLAAILIGCGIGLFAYPNGRLTCGNYVLNAYLYILLSLILASLVATQLGVLDVDSNTNADTNADTGVPSAFRALFSSTIGWMVLFLTTLGALFLTMWTDPRQTVAKHGAWLLFVGCFGVLLHPIYAYTRRRGVFARTALTTLAVVLGLTALAFWRPDWISLSWGPVLLVMLFAGIIMRIVMWFTQPPVEYGVEYGDDGEDDDNENPHATVVRGRWRQWFKWDELLSWGFVVLFSLLLLYDTKRLQVHARRCVVPDYINDSVSIFLDVSNLFANLGRIQ